MIIPDFVNGVSERMSCCSPLGIVDEDEEMVMVPTNTKV